MASCSIPYKVFYRNVKYPRLEFKTGKLIIILPPGQEPYPLLDKYRHWINKQFNFIKGCIDETKAKKLINRTEEDFKALIYQITNEVSHELRVKFNRIYFRKMKTKWASLSPARNLTINRLMKYLPEHLIRYVIFHEMAHLVEKRHNGKFWEIVSRKFSNYQELERELFIYWFLILELL